MSELEARLGIRGRSYWIVGAGGGGIGTAVARELALAGAHVVALDREAAALDPTVEACASTPGTLECHVLDATDRTAVVSFVDEQRTKGGLADGLMNIVGGLGRDQFGSVTATSDETFDAVMQHNLRAAWLTSQCFATAAIETGHGASVVHLASIGALEGLPFAAPYGMAKAALRSMAMTQALEWGPHGIRVNTIAAGTIETPRASPSDPERDRRVLPLGRRGKPEDIAGAALFLFSDLAAWITGQTLVVDGGALVKPSYLDDAGLPVFVDDAQMRARLLGRDAPGS